MSEKRKEVERRIVAFVKEGDKRSSTRSPPRSASRTAPRGSTWRGWSMPANSNESREGATAGESDRTASRW